MSLNGYLLAQAAAATAIAAPTGLSNGELFAGVTLLLLVCGIVYRVGQATQKAEGVETNVARELTAMKGTLAEIKTFMEATQSVRTEWAVWRGDITGRVDRIEDDHDRRTGPTDRRHE